MILADHIVRAPPMEKKEKNVFVLQIRDLKYQLQALVVIKNFFIRDWSYQLKVVSWITRLYVQQVTLD